LRLNSTGTEGFEVYDRDHLLARLVLHDAAFGWKIVDLEGNSRAPTRHQSWP
jgi:hypothetical protein